MVIIEMTPSVDEPLTPTAPPKSWNHSREEDPDQYFTPQTHFSSPPPSRDVPDGRSISFNLGECNRCFETVLNVDGDL